MKFCNSLRFSTVSFGNGLMASAVDCMLCDDNNCCGGNGSTRGGILASTGGGN